EQPEVALLQGAQTLAEWHCHGGRLDGWGSLACPKRPLDGERCQTPFPVKGGPRPDVCRSVHRTAAGTGSSHPCGRGRCPDPRRPQAPLSPIAMSSDRRLAWGRAMNTLRCQTPIFVKGGLCRFRATSSTEVAVGARRATRVALASCCTAPTCPRPEASRARSTAQRSSAAPPS